MTARDEMLRKYTGHDSAWWVGFVQERIAASFRPSGDPRHPYTDVHAWMCAVADEISACVDPEQQDYDENMRAAAIAAVVFTTWACRIRRAKAYDPNRPLDGRLVALERLRDLVEVIVEAATDESRDADYFPTQDWNPPYGPSARGGDFV